MGTRKRVLVLPATRNFLNRSPLHGRIIRGDLWSGGVLTACRRSDSPGLKDRQEVTRSGAPVHEAPIRHFEMAITAESKISVPHSRSIGPEARFIERIPDITDCDPRSSRAYRLIGIRITGGSRFARQSWTRKNIPWPVKFMHCSHLC